jgi:predicted ATPase
MDSDRMIEFFELKNFKSIKNVELDIRPVTILIGPNGSGKSNIIQSLMLLKQSRFNGGLALKGKYRDFIGIEDISFFRDVNQNIEYQIRVKNIFSGKDNSTPDILEYSILNQFKKNDLNSQTISINLNYQNAFFNFAIEQGETYYEKIHQDRRIILSTEYEIRGTIRVEFSGKFSPNKKIKQYQDKLENLLRERLQLIGADFDRIYFIPPIRGIPFPSTPLTDSVSEEFISSETVFKQSQDLLGTLGYEPEITERISAWTERITEVPVKSRVIPSKQATVLSSNQIPINITHEGFGLNQLIFLLVQLYIAPDESLITIEEPESHLHPKAQTELVSVILESIKKKQLKTIITTHSEHILFAFLTNVANKTLDGRDLAIYYFEKTEDGSKISQLDISERGTIEGGLPGFFEANMSAYKAYIDAITQNLNSGSE